MNQKKGTTPIAITLFLCHRRFWFVVIGVSQLYFPWPNVLTLSSPAEGLWLFKKDTSFLTYYEFISILNFKSKIDKHFWPIFWRENSNETSVILVASLKNYHE